MSELVEEEVVEELIIIPAPKRGKVGVARTKMSRV